MFARSVGGRVNFRDWGISPTTWSDHGVKKAAADAVQSTLKSHGVWLTARTGFKLGAAAEMVRICVGRVKKTRHLLPPCGLSVRVVLPLGEEGNEPTYEADLSRVVEDHLSDFCYGDGTVDPQDWKESADSLRRLAQSIDDYALKHSHKE